MAAKNTGTHQPLCVNGWVYQINRRLGRGGNGDVYRAEKDGGSSPAGVLMQWCNTLTTTF